MLQIFSYTKYLLEVVLQWTMIEWKVYNDKMVMNGKAVMNFIGNPTLLNPYYEITYPDQAAVLITYTT